MPGTSEHGAIALAVIGGTGLYRLAALGEVETLEGDTIYGAPSGPVRIGRIGGHAVAFLARHGEGHSLPPHKVNYRANLRRLADLGARRVLAVNAVGGITAAYGPRVVAVPDQLIDYTWGRVSTVCEEPAPRSCTWTSAIRTRLPCAPRFCAPRPPPAWRSWMAAATA